ncbi:MAG: hypothetical protein ABUM51_06690 [Bacteroidota bacterium]
MIQLKKKHTVTAPTILSVKGIAEKGALCVAFDEGQREFKFDNSIYGHPDVKTALRLYQEGKCCFCEAKIEHISYGDVEHYRPKAGWIQGEEKLNQPGYYWLAYDWDNLLLSCQICNQRHKKNFFPLLDATKRALSHEYNLEEESPVFIKPDEEDPEVFIEFKEEIPFPVDDSLRAKTTIEKLGLDREALNERRREKLGLIRDIYNLAKDCPVTTPEIKQKAVGLIKKRAEEFTSDRAEYAAMFRSFFKNNPIDF